MVATNGDGTTAGPDQTFTTASLVTLTSLRLSPPTFRAARRGATVRAAARRRPGSTVRFVLSSAATVKLVVQRRAPGRRSRWVVVGRTLELSGKPGANRLRFSGRSQGRPLRPARYRLVATPITRSRGRPPAAAGFPIVRQPRDASRAPPQCPHALT